MKYICFGYYDKGNFEGMTEGEQSAMFDRYVLDIHALITMSIFAPTGTGLAEKRSSLRKPR